MSIHVKICGLTEPVAALAAAEAGADAVGFVLTRSVRQITPKRATQIAAALPAGVDRVAVFRGPPQNDIYAALTGFAADVVQADYRSLVHLEGFRRLPVFRETMTPPAEIARCAAGIRFVYEGPHSGVGRSVDWETAARVASYGDMTLAGGLTPDNVGDAIRLVAPFGVDVSTGVESSPGVKDPARIRAFVEAVREAEKELVRT